MTPLISSACNWTPRQVKKQACTNIAMISLLVNECLLIGVGCTLYFCHIGIIPAAVMWGAPLGIEIAALIYLVKASKKNPAKIQNQPVQPIGPKSTPNSQPIRIVLMRNQVEDKNTFERLKKDNKLDQNAIMINYDKWGDLTWEEELKKQVQNLQNSQMPYCVYYTILLQNTRNDLPEFDPMIDRLTSLTQGKVYFVFGKTPNAANSSRLIQVQDKIKTNDRLAVYDLAVTIHNDRGTTYFDVNRSTVFKEKN